MHFKKLLTMFTITFFASSGTILSINTHVSNNKLIKNCLFNNHETFSKLGGTSGLIQSITSYQKAMFMPLIMRVLFIILVKIIKILNQYLKVKVLFKQ